VPLLQRARCAARRGSVLGPAGRSAAVCFGDARLALAGRGTEVRGAAVHGVCARGRARVSLGGGATIADCGVRGAYAYHSARLTMARVAVVGTRDPEGAAVQVEALRSGDAASLSMRRCTLRANAGDGVLIRGAVAVAHQDYVDYDR